MSAIGVWDMGYRSRVPVAWFPSTVIFIITVASIRTAFSPKML